MKLRFTLLLCLLAALPAWPQNAGLTPAWDFRKTLDSLTTQTQKLPGLLERVNAQNWIAQGAPAAYAEQSAQLRSQAGYLAQNAKDLSADPSKMSATLTVFLRLETLESMLSSISEGVRKYQDTGLADQLQSVLDENTTNREKLREYLVELVTSRETELSIMDKEAQRCRTLLFQPPAAARTPTRPKQ
jgi:hypothetical protein